MGKEYFDFNNTTAVIAGGATGLGFALAAALVESNCKVIIFSRTKERVDNAVEKLNSLGKKPSLGFALDISSQNDMELLAEHVTGSLKKVNIAINAAGFNIRNPVQDVTLDEWNSVIGTNLTGAFLFARELYPFLKKAEFGRLINITSIFSTVSYPDRASYSSSKGGMMSLTKTLALEWAIDGITVNSISPGPFLTDINKPVLNNPEAYEKFCNRIPFRRFGEPEEIVTAGLFLASPASSYVTACNVIVDGGWTAS